MISSLIGWFLLSRLFVVTLVQWRLSVATTRLERDMDGRGVVGINRLFRRVVLVLAAVDVPAVIYLLID